MTNLDRIHAAIALGAQLVQLRDEGFSDLAKEMRVVALRLLAPLSDQGIELDNPGSNTARYSGEPTYY